MIHIYTGDGKGKTTASAGLATRALGRNLRVGFFSFLKDELSGEMIALQKLGALTQLPEGSYGFVWNMTDEQKAACAAAQQALFAKAQALANELDLLVLDEAVCALDTGMLDRKELFSFLLNLPSHLEVVLTGRGADVELCALADYVTEMTARKHPFDKGADARIGIEY